MYKKDYLVNVAVNAAMFPGLNWIGLSPLLDKAGQLICVKVILFPVIGFSPTIC